MGFKGSQNNLKGTQLFLKFSCIPTDACFKTCINQFYVLQLSVSENLFPQSPRRVATPSGLRKSSPNASFHKVIINILSSIKPEVLK